MRDLLSWRPSFWLYIRRYLAQLDNSMLVDNRRTADHNVHVARKRLAVAQADLARYERELRQIDAARRTNDATIRDDSMVLANRWSR